MSIGSGTEWLPTFGESWQVVQVPRIDGDAERVVEPADAGDGDGLGVEERLRRGTIAPPARRPWLAGDVAPAVVERERVRVERRCARGSPPSTSLMPR